jgi:hypothetical protein
MTAIRAIAATAAAKWLDQGFLEERYPVFSVFW